MTQTVLVVEDEVLVRLDIVDYLSDCGYCVLEATDASDAVTQICARSDIDVIFSDVRMPGPLDGVALARWVIETRPEIAVILTSGHFAQEATLRGIYGTPLFSKPYERAAVHIKIQELLRRPPSESA